MLSNVNSRDAFPLPPSATGSPERRLMAAVLLQAIDDYRLLTAWSRSRKETERKVGHGFWLSHKGLREVEDYFFTDQPSTSPFAATNICEHLGLPLERLRDRLRAGDIPMQRKRAA